jgi:hypothetical protein
MQLAFLRHADDRLKKINGGMHFFKRTYRVSCSRNELIFIQKFNYYVHKAPLFDSILSLFILFVTRYSSEI